MGDRAVCDDLDRHHLEERLDKAEAELKDARTANEVLQEAYNTLQEAMKPREGVEPDAVQRYMDFRDARMRKATFDEAASIISQHANNAQWDGDERTYNQLTDLARILLEAHKTPPPPVREDPSP